MPAGRPAGSPAVGSRRASHGFSLIEVVIAMGIFAFVIIPVIGLVSGGMKNLRQSMDDTVRADIAREIVGQALRTPFSNVVSTNYSFTDEGVRLSSVAGAVFKATTTVTSLPSSSSLGLTTDTNIAKQLIVTVTHIKDTNNNKTVYSQLLINTKQ